ncbi:sulfite exporter TauE/SafE family protein [Cytophagales bacterium LB-30]|uniref:Probable membrane transporter protein n=1 Tax=Shiella aurantiaca TaxID=3058365 RepID=A0ABT8F314_9BACT|nr:sulfite exporter TauE/SafE family protein [Shiella aurantiaca]MDN4164810.1 sulfite exporter TauE/SafE family protein [Shiella aurantiaca]
MEIIAIFGYLASILIGVSLGLIGGGGSILTVPVLVYLFQVNPVMATAYSLFIVGATSLVGSFNSYRKGLVDIKTAVVFGIPSIAAVYGTRKWIIPAIPNELFAVGDFLVTKSILLMLLFAVLMVAASFSMIKKGKAEEAETGPRVFNYPLILLEGVVVGTLTGLVGAGGGFLIIPALVVLSKLPMKMAVGTSLLIIAAKSLLGFLGDASNYEMDWTLLASVTGLSVAGIFLGGWLNNFISGQKLKPAFGWFVLVMGIYILLKETLFR